MEQWTTLARYNRWMNEKLMEECSKLSDEERKIDRGAPFRSIHGLWNHLHLADRVWLSRFGFGEFSARSLDEEVFSGWEELRAAQQEVDATISRWAASLTLEILGGELQFTPMSRPGQITLPMLQVALHFFNHGTHHRGQISALMEQAGLDCGVTDLAAMPQ
ncbi:MAG TPA: DinB family protein [Abditibacteriaceae bacterium]|jgi:uncharacterized damage-inducible protein DinB